MGYTSKYAQERLAKYGKRHVEKGEDPSGGKWKSVETKKKLKEKYKGEDGYKSKQVTNRETGERVTTTKAKGSKKEVVRDNPREMIKKHAPFVGTVSKIKEEYDKQEDKKSYDYKLKKRTEAMKAGIAARKAARKIGLKSQKTVNPNK